MTMTIPPRTHGIEAAPSSALGPIPFPRLVRVEWAKATDTRAARWLLAENGVPSEIRYGWRKDKAGRLPAHAWLECSGQVLIGGDEDLGSYTTFSTSVAAPPSR